MFGKQKTVAGVMAAFTSTISQLTTVAENNDSIVANLALEQERIADTMQTARAEADNARSINKKLSAIIEA